MPDFAVTARAVRYSYRGADTPAVDAVDLQVRAGEVFTVLGPNGAGKTTTIDLLQGYKRPESGSVFVLGEDPSRRHRALMARVGVMLQEPALYSDLKVIEIVRLFASYYDSSAGAEVLSSCGIGHLESRLARTLSGGEKRRVALAVALVGNPDLLFLDEPSAGMDLESRQRFWTLVRDMKSQGKTVFLTTHLIEEAESISDRVAIINRGRVVLTGRVDELTDAPGRVEVTFKTAVDIVDVRALAPNATIHITASNSYVLEQEDAKPVLDAAKDRGLEILEIRYGRRRLSEVYSAALEGEP